jgi:transketolase
MSERAADCRELAQRIREHAIDMTHAGKSSHVASVLSMADIIGVLYGAVLRVNPYEPRWADRDRFILSKGHAGAGIYAALAERAFFPVSELSTHYRNGGRLSGHVSHAEVPGVELSTGSLGHGLSVGTGMAMAARMDGRGHRVFVVMSDGECDEGSVWEAALFVPHHKLTNVVIAIDFNDMQSLASVHETLALEPFADKWRAFGWEVVDVDGHDVDALLAALDVDPTALQRPRCVIARTTKGKGVSFMENTVLWHYRPPQGDDYTNAVADLARLRAAQGLPARSRP